MKKIWVWLVTIIMVFTVSTTSYAANAKIQVSDASAQCTQMVYLTVSLSDCKKANTIGISMDYDTSVLKKVTSGCAWTNAGTLQDFDVASNTGVWATKKAQDLNGDICTLAFRVQTDAPVGDTSVTCEVIVKNDSTIIGTYTASGTVTVTCEHSYGEWLSKDDTLHEKVCNYCETKTTAVHNWDVGEVTKPPTQTEPGQTTYTCKDCGSTKIEGIKPLGEQEQEKPSSGLDGPTGKDEQTGSNVPENVTPPNNGDAVVTPDASEKKPDTDRPGISQDASKEQNWFDILSGLFGSDKTDSSETTPGKGQSTMSGTTTDEEKTDSVSTMSPDVNVENPDLEDEQTQTDDKTVTEDEKDDTSQEEDHPLQDPVDNDCVSPIVILVVVLVILAGLLFLVYKKVRKDRTKRG